MAREYKGFIKRVERGHQTGFPGDVVFTVQFVAPGTDAEILANHALAIDAAIKVVFDEECLLERVAMELYKGDLMGPSTRAWVTADAGVRTNYLNKAAAILKVIELAKRV